MLEKVTTRKINQITKRNFYKLRLLTKVISDLKIVLAYYLQLLAILLSTSCYFYAVSM